MSHDITATLNCAFDRVLHHCADREETWINPTLHANYTALNEMGCCHSLEVWDNGDLDRRGVWHCNRWSVLRREHVFLPNQWLESGLGLFNHPSAQLRLWFV